MEYSYRRLNPHDEKDVKKYLLLHDKLNKSLGAKASSLSPEQVKWLRIRMGATELLAKPKAKEGEFKPKENQMADEICYFCEENGNVIGYIYVLTYHIVDGKRPNDNAGVISEIYVLPEHRNGEIAFQLTQLGIATLLKAGNTSAIMNVQKDNPSRFFHFALADKLICEEPCERENGDLTIDYQLMISDLKRAKAMSKVVLAKRASRIKKQFSSDQTLSL